MISEIVPEGSKDILPILIPFRYEENQYPTGINAYPKKRLRVIKNIPLERSVQLIEKKMRLKIWITVYDTIEFQYKLENANSFQTKNSGYELLGEIQMQIKNTMQHPVRITAVVMKQVFSKV